MSDSAKELAEAVLKAAQLREDSFNHEAYEIARAAREAEMSDSPYGTIGPDPARFYALDLHQAAEQANPAFTEPVYLLLTGTWNDSIHWARTLSVYRQNRKRMQLTKEQEEQAQSIVIDPETRSGVVITPREKILRDLIAQNIRPEYTRRQRREVERKIRKKFSKIVLA